MKEFDQTNWITAKIIPDIKPKIGQIWVYNNQCKYNPNNLHTELHKIIEVKLQGIKTQRIEKPDSGYYPFYRDMCNQGTFGIDGFYCIWDPDAIEKITIVRSRLELILD